MTLVFRVIKMKTYRQQKTENPDILGFLYDLLVTCYFDFKQDLIVDLYICLYQPEVTFSALKS